MEAVGGGSRQRVTAIGHHYILPLRMERDHNGVKGHGNRVEGSQVARADNDLVSPVCENVAGLQHKSHLLD